MTLFGSRSKLFFIFFPVPFVGVFGAYSYQRIPKFMFVFFFVPGDFNFDPWSRRLANRLMFLFVLILFLFFLFFFARKFSIKNMT